MQNVLVLKIDIARGDNVLYSIAHFYYECEETGVMWVPRLRKIWFKKKTTASVRFSKDFDLSNLELMSFDCA